jgi:hypothetical protein
VVFFVSSPSARFESDDALNYAAAVEFGGPESLVFSHHLAYVPLMKILFEGARLVDPDVRALTVMVPAGAIIAAAACGLFVLVLRNWLRVGWPLALFGGAALASSYGFWRYAGEAEVYALAVFLSLLLLLAAVRLRPGPGAAAVLALLALLSITGHLLNIALVLALPYLLYKRGWSLRLIGLTAAIGAVLLVPTLWGAYQFDATHHQEQASLGGLGSFYTGTESSSDLSASDLVAAVAVISSLVVGTNWVFQHEPLRDLVSGVLPGHAVQDELYMGSMAPGWVKWAAPLALLLLSAAVYLLLRAPRSTPIAAPGEGRFLIFWIAAYLGLTGVAGSIVQPEVWLLFLVPLWLSIVFLLRKLTLPSRSLVLVAGALFLSSLVGGLLPVHLGGDRQADSSAWLADHTTAADLLLTADSSGFARYVAYQRPPQVVYLAHSDYIESLKELILEGETTSEIAVAAREERRLLGHQPPHEGDGDLYVTRDVFDPPDWLVRSNPVAAAALIDLGAEVGHLFTPVEGSDLYLVRRHQG